MISTASIPTYTDLLTAFPPRPIKSEVEFQAVQDVIDRLIDDGELSAAQQDYLNLLGLLVQDYEEQQVPIPDVYGVELLKVLIVEQELRQKDLVVVFKTESIVSAVLNGQRGLTVEHIERLAEFFHISPASFFKR
jgi:HTH-type transcriptional regulator / antitoxin HigA